MSEFDTGAARIGAVKLGSCNTKAGCEDNVCHVKSVLMYQTYQTKSILKTYIQDIQDYTGEQSKITSIKRLPNSIGIFFCFSAADSASRSLPGPCLFVFEDLLLSACDADALRCKLAGCELSLYADLSCTVLELHGVRMHRRCEEKAFHKAALGRLCELELVSSRETWQWDIHKNREQ